MSQDIVKALEGWCSTFAWLSAVLICCSIGSNCSAQRSTCPYRAPTLIGGLSSSHSRNCTLTCRCEEKNAPAAGAFFSSLSFLKPSFVMLLIALVKSSRYRHLVESVPKHIIGCLFRNVVVLFFGYHTCCSYEFSLLQVLEINVLSSLLQTAP